MARARACSNTSWASRRRCPRTRRLPSPKRVACTPTSGRFISNQIYEGRLSSHESCAQQGTEFGTGLRWLELFIRIARRNRRGSGHCDIPSDRDARTPWVNQRGEEAPLRAEDFMVVAPTTTRCDSCVGLFDRNAEVARRPVGTVDKFQGRESPVVFFTMTTSSGEECPAGRVSLSRIVSMWPSRAPVSGLSGCTSNCSFARTHHR